MRFLKLLLAVLTVAAATIGSEMVVGQRAFRAEQELMLADAAQRLTEVPEVIGDWQMTSESQFAARIVKTLDCRGYVCRQYQNQKSRQSVSVVLLVGPPGPLVAHRPEVCMDGQGYQLVAGPQRMDFSAGNAAPQSLYRSTFAVGNSRQKVAVYYGWARGSTYEAPEWPRLELGREPMLYKIQVSTNLDGSRRASDQRDAGQQFVSELLPIVNSFWSSPAKQPASETSVRTTAGTSWLDRVVRRWIW